MYICIYIHLYVSHIVVVVVFFTLTDRASTIPSNIVYYFYPDASSCQSLLLRLYGTKVVVALAAGLCFHLHCGSTPGGGSHRVLLRTISWWNYRTVGDKVDWSEGCPFPYLYRG